MYKILSIDGGGIRGIIPAMILAKIEEITNRPICQLFDMIAGTSTGGILTLGLTKPKTQTNIPQYKAKDLVDFYKKDGKIIFSKSLLHKYISLNGIIDAKYNSNPIQSVLKKYFGNTMLSEALTEVFITSYETELRTPFFFRSRLAKNKQINGYDFEMWEVGRSTSAAPTYFKPYKLSSNIKKGYYSLIDGGVYANNPAMCAYSEARSVYNSENDIFILSIGTGESAHSINYDDAKKWGLIRWASPVFDISMGGVNSTVEHQLKQLLPNNRHYRFQVNLSELSKDEIDDPSDKNIFELQTLAEKLINTNMENKILNKICAEIL